MQITLDLPDEIAQYLGEDSKALSLAALEGLVAEGVRAGKLSTAQGRRILGLRSRNEMDAFLKAHGVELSLNIDQVRRDSETALAFTK